MGLLEGSPLLLVIAAAVITSFTVLFPVLAAVVTPLTRRYSNHVSVESQVDLAILIPAYKESKTLPLTLTSIEIAIVELQRVYPAVRVTIAVGLDGADLATKTACDGHGIILTEFPENIGKWKVLRALVPKSTAKWVALTDAGTLWPRDFLVKLWPDMNNTRYGGLAPGYVQPTASLAERVHWALERTLKLIENLSGGPVSVHGATVLYRTSIAQEAFRQLGAGPWYNDDVVIPLIVRAWGHRIRYYGAAVAVSDAGIAQVQREGNRRTRMVEGNLQWIASLWWPVSRLNPVVGLLAARRGLRPFWLYLAIIPYLAVLTIVPWSLALFIVCATGALALEPRVQAAALASLRAPRQVFNRNHRGVSWS